MSTTPWPSADSAFQRTEQQIAREERNLRLLAESQLRDYVALVQEIAAAYLPEELDALKRRDPHFINQATAGDWRSLFLRARAAAQRAPLWTAAADAPALRAEISRLQAQVTRLTAERTSLAGEAAVALPPGAAAPAGAPAVPPVRVVTPRAAGAAPVASGAPADGGVPAAGVPASDDSLFFDPAAFRLPALPAEAPAAFKLRFKNATWERGGKALAYLAYTGWSMRLAVAELLAADIGVGVKSQPISRVFETLAQEELIEQLNEQLNWDGRDEAGQPLRWANGDAVTHTRLIIVRLTARGRECLRAAGLPARPSEWDWLAALHNGATQQHHLLQVISFADQARRRGYLTRVCPPVAVAPTAGAPTAGASSPPDMLLAPVTAPAERIYVEVEGESGTPERRMRKWQHQAALQGFVALCAHTPTARLNLVNEARAAGVAHGRATDLQTLIYQGTERGRSAGAAPADDRFWLTEW